MSDQITQQSAAAKAEDAAAAALTLAGKDDATRSEALEAIASSIEGASEEILAANERDVAAAEQLLADGEYTQAFVDRLTLSAEKIDSIAEMVRSVADQTNPLGRTRVARHLDDGLDLYERTVPLGVVGSVFESRPDALVQIASLCLKSGNAAILKGGSEALHTNRVLYELIRDASEDPPDGWIQLIEAREDVDTLLGMDDRIDLMMPRGSADFVRYIQQNTSIPVLGHSDGVCHVYVDRLADLEMATEIAFDAKVQYPAVCNAVETLLVHQAVAEEFLPAMAARYRGADVEMRGDEVTREHIDIAAASEPDWATEYGDLIVSIRVVGSLEDAIDHVTTYGSKHTDAIVTADDERAQRFMLGLDSASVFHNASTRFSDGYRFGLGAEVGISTGKTHARGPVGLEGLTTYQYYLEGDGHVVGDYVGPKARSFTHEEFDGEWPPT